MFKRLAVLLVPLAAALALAPTALSAGGRYTFVGGNAVERSQVVQALNASSFPWDIIPGTIVVHVEPRPISEATPGAVWLDNSLLDSGDFSWGVIQHEFAHQVDFALLDPGTRLQLGALLGGVSWWNDGIHDHGSFASERFASEIAWAYWPSTDNCLRPASANDEAGHVPPALFRAALVALLPQATPAPAYEVTRQSAPAVTRAHAAKKLRKTAKKPRKTA